MGYQALLFCPDEKTARTVTQVLSELEFSVESCIEPFAAVKKLMGQHFDAVVVDCDNEQNATLLFKSARNSTSNQASLAVAVVEGQAGVAKAFRIGANLVLTKPINIEQAKGTLRVARGLLRKGDPAKPAAAPASVVPMKPPVAAKPVPPAKPVVPATPAPISTSLPPAPVAVKPTETPIWPAVGAASSASVPVHVSSDDDLLDVSSDDAIPAHSPAAMVEAAFSKVAIPEPPAAKSSKTDSSSPSEVKTVFNPPSRPGSGAASAPAPARELRNSQVSEVPTVPAPAEALSVSRLEAGKTESPTYVGSEPSFTFGGANVSEKPSGGNKKIIFGIAAAALVAAGLYFGWAKFHGDPSQSPVNQSPVNQTQASAPAPIAAPPTLKPSANPVAPLAAKTSAIAPTNSTPSPNTHSETAQPKNPASNTDSAFGNDVTVTNLPKATSSSSPAEAKTAETARLLKGGSAPAVHTNTAAPDAPAPSMIGIATTGNGAPPPDLAGEAANAPRPVLQAVNVSQGVSQGLLIKKVQPVYPRNAVFMKIEGSVELMATVSKTGDISHVKVLSGDSQLSRAAVDAVKMWKYRPYLLNGQPVEIQTQVTLNFKLPK